MKTLLIICLVIGLIGCSGESKPELQALNQNSVILAFGDSLTYGIGAAESRSYPRRLERALGIEVINAGIPGEVSAKGRQRLPKLLKRHQPDLVILMHGGNDILRQLPKPSLANNLGAMVDMIRTSGAQVLFLGVPSFSVTFRTDAVYDQVAEHYGLVYERDIMSEILRKAKLKADMIHPNAAGYEILTDRLLQSVRVE